MFGSLSGEGKAKLEDLKNQLSAIYYKTSSIELISTIKDANRDVTRDDVFPISSKHHFSTTLLNRDFTGYKKWYTDLALEITKNEQRMLSAFLNKNVKNKVKAHVDGTSLIDLFTPLKREGRLLDDHHIVVLPESYRSEVSNWQRESSLGSIYSHASDPRNPIYFMWDISNSSSDIILFHPTAVESVCIPNQENRLALSSEIKPEQTVEISATIQINYHLVKDEKALLITPTNMLI